MTDNTQTPSSANAKASVQVAAGTVAAEAKKDWTHYVAVVKNFVVKYWYVFVGVTAVAVILKVY